MHDLQKISTPTPTAKMSRLKILSWNVNSILNRDDKYKDFMSENDIDVVMLQETKHTDIPITIRNYQHFTIDPMPTVDGRCKQGLITYVKNNIGVRVLPPLSLGKNVQTHTIALTNNGKDTIKLTNVYSPHGTLNLDSLWDEDKEAMHIIT